MKNNLHILQLPSWYLPYGGQFVRNQTQVLRESGFTVNVLANIETNLRTHKWQYLTHPLKSVLSDEDGFPVYRYFFRAIPKFGKINVELYVAKTLQMFEKYCKKFGKPDIIHVHSAIWAGVAAAKIKEKYGVPYVITEHFSGLSLLCDYAKSKITESQKPYYTAVYSNADFIVPVSDVILPAIETFLTKKIPIRPISNIIDTDFYYYQKRRPTKKIKFIATNGFYFQKGYDTLISAFDYACNKNKNIEITIAGENFDTKKFQNTLWKNVKNKDKFHFTGKLTAENVRDELWKADIFIIPSRAESQSQSTLEALCTGLPIVATNTIPKIMTTPDNAIVVPVEDITAMTTAILKMSETYKNYDGKAISEHIKTVCGKEVFVKAIMEVYNHVLENK